MRGISTLIDVDGMDDSTNLADETSIMSVEPAPELPKKKVVRSKPTTTNNGKPKAAPRKPKAAKDEAGTKAAGRSGPAKRKAVQEQGNDELEQPPKKRSVAQTYSDDEMDGLHAAPIANKNEKPKPKRKAKPKKDIVEVLIESDQIEELAVPAKDEGPQTATVGEEESAVIEFDNKPDPNPSAGRPQVKKPVREPARTRPDAMSRRRAGSASDTERSDPNLRRKLGDITRKFENVDLRYRSLKEVGIVEANANMEKLRRQCEATTSASTELISSLKTELAMHMPLAHEARQLQADLKESKTEGARSHARVAELESSLATAQNEIKSLQAKLAAARSSSTPVDRATSKTPGSAKKSNGQAKTVMVGSAEAVQAAQTAQLKEELYSDLTGLIVRGVKRTDEGDSYDCIQTGRNGSECDQIIGSLLY